jgi:hypothetical protein
MILQTLLSIKPMKSSVHKYKKYVFTGWNFKDHDQHIKIQLKHNIFTKRQFCLFLHKYDYRVVSLSV